MNAPLQDRIADLERELVSLKLQIACAKSSVDSLKLELAKFSSTLAKTASSSVTPFYSEASPAISPENNRSATHITRYQSEITAAMQMHYKIKRITDLERELVSLKLELACAKSYADNLRLQLAKSSDLAKTTCSNDHHLESSPVIGAENGFWPMFHPLSLKMSCNESAVNRAQKVLNRGTCHFTLQLFEKIDSLLHPPTEVDSRGWSMLSLRRTTTDNIEDRLNQKTYASDLNLQLQSCTKANLVSMACAILLSTQSLSGAFSILLSTQDDDYNPVLRNNLNTYQDRVNRHTALGDFLRFC